MGILLTIGHSQHNFKYFQYLLKKYDINYLLDVRSVPYSKYSEIFNREILSIKLKDIGIKYSFMGDYFGARLNDLSLYGELGYLDFEKVIKSEKFNKGLQNVIKGLNKGNNIVLMCTEKDPIDCHRAIMVSRAFYQKGVNIKHILADGSFETQKDLENRLINKYFSNRQQLSLFNNTLNDKEYILLAYNKKNKEIGYHIN